MNALEEIKGLPPLDELEAWMAAQRQAECPVVHRFTPGLYIREITMPAGTLATTMVHKTRHPFTISKGRVRVVSSTEGIVELAAPFTGITEPGTRRLLYVVEETVWTTYHATDETDVEKIGRAIVKEPDNPLIAGKHVAGWLLELPGMPIKEWDE